MKRYFNFLRSGATVSLVMLYALTTLFSPFLINAEEIIKQESIISEAVIEEVSAYSVPEERFVEEQIIETEEVISVLEIQEIFVSEETLPLEILACTPENSPTISFEATYADAQENDGDAVAHILSQLGAEAIDAEDGALSITHNLESFLPFNAGWHEAEFTATDSDGCITIETVDVFIIASDFAPVCESGYIYVRAEFPDTLEVALGTNSLIESGQWFPVMYNGETFIEDEYKITIDHDISVVRNGPMLLINVGPAVVDGDIIAQSIVDSLEITGGQVVSALVFSGNVAIIEIIPSDCPPIVCTPENGPNVSVTTETVTIEDTNTLTVEDVLALFGITTSDGDGEGIVTMTSDLLVDVLNTEGSYTITLTLIDNEGCRLSQELTLIVEHTNGGGGGGGGGNGGGGGGGGNNNDDDEDDEPEGEVLGESTCVPYLSTFIQMGEANLKADVIRLQTFLNEYMNAGLVVDGVYGPATFEAVKVFQAQEFDEILAPWGITEPTGIVRETTMRHINNIMCPELNIAMPILYCATTGNLIYPDGTIVDPDPEYILYHGQPIIKTWVVSPNQEVLGTQDYRYEK